MIVHASIDENNKSKNGKAGDQTSREVCSRDWYDKSWNCMLRYHDSKIASKVSAIALRLASSNLVGYDQNQRNTLYSKLKAFNWNVDAYIKSGIKTETDCSAFIYACYCCEIPSMRSYGNAPTTSTMQAFYDKHGFDVYISSKYLKNDKELLAGDILVKKGSHTVMNVSNNVLNKIDDTSKYYMKYTGVSSSITTALAIVGEKDTSLLHRKIIARVNGIENYTGSATQNMQMLSLLKNGKLKRG